MEKTKALVLKHIKYGDSSLISHFYTREFGMLSFIFKGFYKSKKKNRVLLFPLAEVELAFSQNPKSDLKYAQNLQTLNALSDCHTHPVKSLILQLLAEVLHTVLKQDEPNYKLYDFILKQLYIFEEKPRYFAEFHLIFLMQLTSYLGFNPNTEDKDFPYFDLQEGHFSEFKNTPFTLTENNTRLLKQLMNLDFKASSLNVFNQSQRRELLNILLLYYQLHLPEFREPKSLAVIKMLF